MASSDTTYAVHVKYDLAGNAESGIKGIGKAAEKAHEGVFTLKHAVEALALREVFNLGKEALIDFNSEMDKLKIGMTTVMQLNLHMPFEKASAAADKLFVTFQSMAKKSPVTTKDFMDMAAAIAPAVAGAGGGPDKLAKLTKGAITAGLAYGKDPQTTAMAISEMMMGNARKSNPLAMSLIGSTGMDHNAFNQMDPIKRAQTVEKILTDPALDKAANRFGETLVGQSSTFKDQVQIALGEVGLPLSKMLTAEFKKMNTWIEKHPKTISDIMHRMQAGIKTAFEFVRGVGEFLVKNADTLMTLGKIFLVFKGGQLAQGAIKGLISSVSGMVKSFTDAKAGIGGAIMGEGGLIGTFAKLAPTALAVLPALGALTTGLYFAAGWVSKNMPNTLEAHNDTKVLQRVDDAQNLLFDFEKDAKRVREIDATTNMTDELKTERMNLVNHMNDPEFVGGIIKGINELDPSHKFSKMTPSEFQENGLGISKEGFMNMTGHQSPATQLFGAGVGDQYGKDAINKIGDLSKSILDLNAYMGYFTREEIFKGAFPEKYGPPKMPEASGSWEGAGKPEVNITIQKVEVASEDPDRFVFGLVKIGEQATKHKTASQHATSGGF